MVKQISHIILSFFFLTSTVGVTLSAHYCGGTMQEIGLTGTGHHCCSGDMCGQCENHTITYKLTGDYLVSVTPNQAHETPSFDIFGYSTELFHFTPLVLPEHPGMKGNYMPLLHAPPPDPVITQSFRC